MFACLARRGGDNKWTSSALAVTGFGGEGKSSS